MLCYRLDGCNHHVSCQTEYLTAQNVFMVVPGMTYGEIVSEIKKDIPYVLDVSDKKEGKVRRAILKSSIFPVRLFSFVTSKNRNRWMLLWEACGKKSIGDNVLFSMVCIVNNSNGRMAIMPSFHNTGEPTFFIFLPHFFQRFANRMGIKLSGEELIKRYFQYNPNFSIDTKKEMVTDKQYAIRASGTSTDGIALGYQLLDGSFFFKTFITYDMAKGEQLKEFFESEERRKRNHEDFLNMII